MSAPARCAVHPGRPAVDRCPVCARARCGSDAALGVRGCPGCIREAIPDGPRGPDPVERYVRGALAASAMAFAGGAVAQEYVGAPSGLAYVAPFVLGVLCAAAASRAARTDGRGLVGARVRLLAILYGVLGAGLGFQLEGSLRPLSLHHQVLLAYLCATAGAVVWTIPPKERVSRPGGGAG